MSSNHGYAAHRTAPFHHKVLHICLTEYCYPLVVIHICSYIALIQLSLFMQQFPSQNRHIYCILASNDKEPRESDKDSAEALSNTPLVCVRTGVRLPPHPLSSTRWILLTILHHC